MAEAVHPAEKRTFFAAEPYTIIDPRAVDAAITGEVPPAVPCSAGESAPDEPSRAEIFWYDPDIVTEEESVVGNSIRRAFLPEAGESRVETLPDGQPTLQGETFVRLTKEPEMPKTTAVPKGNYPKSVKVHYLDLGSEAEELLSRLPGHRRQAKELSREAGVSVIMMAMEAGDALREHAAKGVAMVQVLSGHVTLASDDNVNSLTPGQLVLFQPDICHDVEAVERSVVLLIVTGGDA